jgi:hypothetical protein
MDVFDEEHPSRAVSPHVDETQWAPCRSQLGSGPRARAAAAIAIGRYAHDWRPGTGRATALDIRGQPRGLTGRCRVD